MPIVKIAIGGQPLLELDIEKYVVECLNAEMPASWHPEARKAQADCIRSYGLARMAERGWLYADQRDQVWNPAKWTPSADEIVAATAGIVGAYNGNVIPTFYSSACGRMTTDRPFGTQVPYLRAAECPCGREKAGHGGGMCQYGAKALAEQGKTWREILDFYYKHLEWVGNYGEVGMTKTSAHVQRSLSWMQQGLVDMGTEWVKIVNPAETDPFPRTAKKVVRIWTDDIDAGFIAGGEAGGRNFVRRMLPEWKQRPWAMCYSLANEPDCNSNSGLWNLCAYSIGAMREASANGIKVNILDLPEGNPHDNGTGDPGVSAWKLQQLAPAVKEAVATGHYVGKHAYWRPGVEGPLGRWHALGRIEWDVEVWRQLGVDVSKLKLLVTEWGVDGGIAPKMPGYAPKTGWRKLYADPTVYYKEVAEGERRAQELPWLHGLFLFDWGPESEWVTFGHDEGDVRSIIKAIGPTVPLPPPPQGPTDDEIRNLAWNYVGVAYNPTHAYPQYAREQGLGAPLGGTFDHKGIRIQPFMGGIVKCVLAPVPDNTDWRNTTHIKW